LLSRWLGDILAYFMSHSSPLKAKFHYASCFEALSKLVADRFEAGRRPASNLSCFVPSTPTSLPSGIFGRLLGWYTIIYTRLTEFCQAQTSLYVQVLRSPVLACWQRYCTVVEQRASAKICGVNRVTHGMELRNLSGGRHLYSSMRPSRWASAHI